jgi:hypothetical protein
VGFIVDDRLRGSAGARFRENVECASTEERRAAERAREVGGTGVALHGSGDCGRKPVSPESLSERVIGEDDGSSKMKRLIRSFINGDVDGMEDQSCAEKAEENPYAGARRAVRLCDWIANGAILRDTARRAGTRPSS